MKLALTTSDSARYIIGSSTQQIGPRCIITTGEDDGHE
jgi:hypothetical protein